MAIERRDILRMIAAASVTPMFPFTARAAPGELYAAALREPDGTFAVALFSPETGIVMKSALPGRGHSCLRRPGRMQCVVFARRPGTFAVALDVNDRRAPVAFASSPGRHFYGHGAFSRDGRLLYTTENDYDDRRGVIGVRDVDAGYRLIGEFPSGGTGPHDIAMLPDGRTLVIANGGIETHPDFGRELLNLKTMAPSLVYIDAETGDLLESHSLPGHMHQLSIRHLAACADRAVVFGCQHKGAKNVTPNLVGFHRRGEDLELAEIPETANGRLKGYVGSVAADASGEIVAVTSPRGGVALYFDVSGRRFLRLTAFSDASGVAGRAGQRGFVLTSGSGRIAGTNGDGDQCLGAFDVAWDNHLTAIR
ncbi:MAG: DUF1513 domain-containing protein [Hyphomicrobiaceae bacterium]|nr:DUF1513 domain-containing protein [Hyphomicrobiaceae bacterium]